MNEDLWVPVVMFTVIGVITWAFFFYRYRTRSEMQATVRQAIEKGHELTPELLARLGQPKDPKSVDLRRGVVAITIGLAFAVFAYILGEEDALRPMIAVGSFPFLIGVAYLGLWQFTKRDD